MSKKITHEQAREGLLQVYIYNDIHTNEANYVLIRDYISQKEELEKHLEARIDYEKKLSNDRYNRAKELKIQSDEQTKLLELYKEYFNTTETIFELNKYVKLSIPNDIRKNYHKKLEQIKELENDSKRNV